MAIDISKYKNAVVLNHPLITHKITQLRDKDTKTNQFRLLVKEIAILEGYEALRHLPTHDVEIVTPVEKTVQPVVDRKSLCFVPILRAGLGMADGMAELVPGAISGHIGLYRNEETHEPVEYYCKLPADISEKDVYLVDPMLATGGSAIDAVRMLKSMVLKKLHSFVLLQRLKVLKCFVKLIQMFHCTSVHWTAA